MFMDDFGTFGEEEETRVITQKHATRAHASAWGNPSSRKYWLLRGKPLLIMAKADLQAKIDDQLAVTEKVVTQLYAIGGFDLQDDTPENLQGTQVGRDITLLERFDILARGADGDASGPPVAAVTSPLEQILLAPRCLAQDPIRQGERSTAGIQAPQPRDTLEPLNRALCDRSP